MTEGESREKSTGDSGALWLFPELEEPPRPQAWQPFTPRGVALFAEAGLARLLGVELIMALLAAGTVSWFLLVAWMPEIRKAIAQLPEQGYIQNQQLYSPRTSPEPLAAGPFLGLAIDLDERSKVPALADLYVKFHRHELRIYSILGYAQLPYPAGWTIQFNRMDLEPRWGAWRPFVLAGVGLVVVLGLIAIWAVLATVYAPIVWTLARWRSRQCTLGGAWRVASAALMPGAAFLLLGIGLYGVGLLPLVSFCVMALLHVVPPWYYLFLAPAHLPYPAAGGTGKTNPFSQETKTQPGERRPGPFG